jgi:hypothetical protein
LRRPDSPADLVFADAEVNRCVDIVSKHDLWKVDPPEPPPTNDKLAVVCLEGDVLWPLHPIGVLADLERPNKKSETKNFAQPSVWKKQLEESHKTLVEFRSKWVDAGVSNDDFVDSESIFRTNEGHMLYREWRSLWSL